MENLSKQRSKANCTTHLALKASATFGEKPWSMNFVVVAKIFPSFVVSTSHPHPYASTFFNINLYSFFLGWWSPNLLVSSPSLTIFIFIICRNFPSSVSKQLESHWLNWTCWILPPPFTRLANQILCTSGHVRKQCSMDSSSSPQQGQIMLIFWIFFWRFFLIGVLCFCISSTSSLYTLERHWPSICFSKNSLK